MYETTSCTLNLKGRISKYFIYHYYFFDIEGVSCLYNKDFPVRMQDNLKQRMETHQSVILLLFVTCFLSCIDGKYVHLTRNDFPDNFIFGTASAAYQVHHLCFIKTKSLSIYFTYLLGLTIFSFKV